MWDATRRVKVVSYDSFFNYEFLGMIGMATEPNEVGNVMFYPDRCIPYRIVLKNELVEDID